MQKCDFAPRDAKSVNGGLKFETTRSGGFITLWMWHIEGQPNIRSTLAFEENQKSGKLLHMLQPGLVTLFNFWEKQIPGTKHQHSLYVDYLFASSRKAMD